MSIATVNVIEYSDDAVLGIRSFDDDEKGNSEAEEIYSSVIREHDPDVTESEMSLFIEDGYYEQGSYQVFLAHSVN